MNSVISYIKQNFLELIITFCILSNLFGFCLPHFSYYIALILLGIKMKEMGVKHNKNSSLFILFILLIVISSFINMMLDLRLVLFSFILILACPIYTSLRWHLYKKKIFILLIRNLSYFFFKHKGNNILSQKSYNSPP